MKMRISRLKPFTLLYLLFLSLILLTSCGSAGLLEPERNAMLSAGVTVYIDEIPLVTLPEGSVVERIDLSLSSKIKNLYQSGRLIVFFGTASSPTPFPEEGYASARLEALQQMAQFIHSRVQSVETKLNTTISTLIEDQNTKSEAFAVTQSVLKKTEKLFVDVRIYGGREIVWYKYHKTGELPRYGVVVLYDPYEAYLALMSNTDFRAAFEEARQKLPVDLSKELETGLEETLGLQE